MLEELQDNFQDYIEYREASYYPPNPPPIHINVNIHEQIYNFTQIYICIFMTIYQRVR
jgi:hypothetical protein